MGRRRDRLTGWTVTVERTIARAVEEVFALLTDVERTAGLGPEHSMARWFSEAREAGAQFLGVNRIGALTWEVVCTVTDFERPHRFGWTVGDLDQPSSSWAYTLEETFGPTGEATIVTQTFTHGPGDSFVRRATARAPFAANVIIAQREVQLNRNMRAVLAQVDAQIAGSVAREHIRRDRAG